MRKFLLYISLIISNVSYANNQNEILVPISPNYNINKTEMKHVLPDYDTHQKIKEWKKNNKVYANNIFNHNSIIPSITNKSTVTPLITNNIVSDRTLSFGGGYVLNKPSKVFIVYYGSQWGNRTTSFLGYSRFSNDTYSVASRLESFYASLGYNNGWYNVLTQYCDSGSMNQYINPTNCTTDAKHIPTTQNVLGGVYYDDSTLSPQNATIANLQSEVIKAKNYFMMSGLWNDNLYSNQIIIASPPGTNPDNFNIGNSNFCAWHSIYAGVPYTNQPYTPNKSNCTSGGVSLEDAYVAVASHEYAETLTNPNVSTGWVNRTGSAYNGEEVTDECNWETSYVNGFYLMKNWSNYHNACISEIVNSFITTTGNFNYSGSGEIRNGKIYITYNGTNTTNLNIDIISTPSINTELIYSHNCPSVISQGQSCNIDIVYESICKFEKAKLNINITGNYIVSKSINVYGTSNPKNICYYN